jgi:hypothetical protein
MTILLEEVYYPGTSLRSSTYFHSQDPLTWASQLVGESSLAKTASSIKQGQGVSQILELLNDQQIRSKTLSYSSFVFEGNVSSLVISTSYQETKL